MDGERRSLNLRGRPSFLINDQLVEGAAPLAALAAIIDAAP
jgi:protein-disulfide isomerase